MATDAGTIASTGRVRATPHRAALLLLVMSIGAIASPGPLAAGSLSYDGQPPQAVCGLCHGLGGVSPMAKFPSLAGQKAAYIEKQLADFAAGRRTNDGGQMSSIVTEISADQLPVVAQYFSGLPAPKPSSADGQTAAMVKARHIYERGKPAAGVPACVTCHAGAAAAAPLAPHLAAQHARYLRKQLSDFAAGVRTNDPAATMRRIASKLTAAEIEALSIYIASLPRKGV